MISRSTPVGDVKKRRGRFKNVYISDNELEELHREFGSFADEQIEQLSAYKAEQERKYKNDYAAIVSWCLRKKAQMQKFQSFPQHCYSDEQLSNMFTKLDELNFD